MYLNLTLRVTISKSQQCMLHTWVQSQNVRMKWFPEDVMLDNYLCIIWVQCNTETICHRIPTYFKRHNKSVV